MLRKGGKEARQAVLFFQQGNFGGIERQQREERYLNLTDRKSVV